MKKLLAMLIIAAVVVTSGFVVYAESEDLPDWFTEMMDWRKGEIEEALESERITAEEAEAWLEHLEEMEAYHLEEGFDGYGPGSGCRGQGFGGAGRGGFGRGCRGGWYGDSDN